MVEVTRISSETSREANGLFLASGHLYIPRTLLRAGKLEDQRFTCRYCNKRIPARDIQSWDRDGQIIVRSLRVCSNRHATCFVKMTPKKKLWETLQRAFG